MQEFQSLKSHNTIYKLIGPGLVPQDPTEAKANVEKRLEFIKNEMCVCQLSVTLTPLPPLCSDSTVRASRSRSRTRRR